MSMIYLKQNNTELAETCQSGKTAFILSGNFATIRFPLTKIKKNFLGF